MKLIKARIRGLDSHTESNWFDLNSGLNLFRFPTAEHGRKFLRILQTINPTYPVREGKPFAEFPDYIQQDGYTKHVNPAKRTVAMAVFSATPQLVKDLAKISPLLYETDRIEVGRRLDYSRWINFVELASSTRWSEIADDMQTLQQKVETFAPDRSAALKEITGGLKPSDRVKDSLKDQLAHWLEKLPANLPDDCKELAERLLTAVRRADYFRRARTIVRIRMPLLVVIGSSPPGGTNGQPGSASQLQDSASLAHLLQLITEWADTMGRISPDQERTFIRVLNEQLGELQPSSMKMRLVRSSGELLLINDKPSPKTSDGPLFSLRQMQAKACLAVALSRIIYKTEAILLFDEPETGFPPPLHRDLTDFVLKISKTSQCLYSYSEADIFPQDVGGRRYVAAELDLMTK